MNGCWGGRSGEESPEDGKRKKTYLLWTHHEKRGNMLGERHHAGHNAGKSEKRKTENWLGYIKEWTGLTMEVLIRLTEDRRRWRNIVHDAADPRNEDG